MKATAGAAAMIVRECEARALRASDQLRAAQITHDEAQAALREARSRYTDSIRGKAR
jgi:hypothetical protein